MHRYTESYKYDEVGNIIRLVHRTYNGNWIRTYSYNESSVIEPEKKNNRLTQTQVGSIVERYLYDINGNAIKMPHLNQMDWNYLDQLQLVDRGGGCKVYYIYDSKGQRVRKVREQNGRTIEERIYLG